MPQQPRSERWIPYTGPWGAFVFPVVCLVIFPSIYLPPVRSLILLFSPNRLRSRPCAWRGSTSMPQLAFLKFPLSGVTTFCEGRRPPGPFLTINPAKPKTSRTEIMVATLRRHSASSPVEYPSAAIPTRPRLKLRGAGHSNGGSFFALTPTEICFFPRRRSQNISCSTAVHLARDSLQVAPKQLTWRSNGHPMQTSSRLKHPRNATFPTSASSVGGVHWL